MESPLITPKKLVLGCSAFLLAFAGVVSWYAYPRVALEGVFGAAVGVSGLLEDSTYFSPGYSDRAFLTIKPGMSPEHVRKTLGSPLKNYFVKETGETGWLYSWKGRDTSYHVRCVLFQGGVVSARLSE